MVMPGTTGPDVLRQLGEQPETAAIPVVIRTSLQLGEIDPASVARAAGVFSKSDDSMRALADLISVKIAAASEAHPGGE